MVGPHDSEALRFKNKTEVIDIIFYTTQHDAMEESAYLVGKRPDEREADTALRRSRSVGGIIQGMTVAVAGGIGVGRTAGVIDTSGMSVGTAPVPVVGAKTAEEEAVAAVESLKPYSLGQVTMMFPRQDLQGAISNYFAQGRDHRRVGWCAHHTPVQHGRLAGRHPLHGQG